MHIETIRFERVFDVQSEMFSFESGGKREFAVAFDRKSVPVTGSTFAVAFEEAGNWQTVSGWRDLSTTRVKLQRSAWGIAIDLLLDMYLYGIPILVIVLGGALLLGGPWAALLAVVLMVLGACAIVFGGALHNRQIEQALLAVSPDQARTVTAPDTQARHPDPTAPAR